MAEFSLRKLSVLGVSVLSAALRGEPTGQPQSWRGDAVAVAKRDLRAGEVLDGEGGYTVWGKLMPAADSAARRALPIGLAHKVKVKRDLAEGATVSWDDVDFDASSLAAVSLSPWVRLGAELRVRGELVDDLHTDEDVGRTLDLLLGPALSLTRGPWSIDVLAGWQNLSLSIRLIQISSRILPVAHGMNTLGGN